ncbi:MAG: B12-binding domain-containing radical SAM protein [Acidobacteria bacterium]|nr:MAG: B12-binding domain-containing radical SAM protein [Acidobacteriota bacterium]
MNGIVTSSDVASPFQTAPNSENKRAAYTPRNKRKILCVFPKYSRSFGTFHHTYKLMHGLRACMPPQGIMVIAAYLPQQWDVRLIDENIKPASDADYRWADAVLVSGMHIQRNAMNQINERAHRFGKITALGGPSVSACAEYYPDFDLLHLGELGDATDQLIQYLDKQTERPERQIEFKTVERLPMQQFPVPAYHLLPLQSYLMATIQFSSGCPYTCEFCDIPELYGRNPRLKSPQQVCAELDAILKAGNPGGVYFVDDNFVGNRKAALELVPHLVEWQKKNGYPLQFACEATLNIAKSEELLALMREAYFATIFCGIETPETAALKAISKSQNLSVPMLDSIKLLNSYGLEVVSGIILGLDTDTEETADHVLEFIRLSQIPMLTINILYALPKTPLWRRLEKEGRLVPDENRESNVKFLLPYDQVVEKWRYCITAAYQPEFVYERFIHNIHNTFSHRIPLAPSKERVNFTNICKGLDMLLRVFVRVGIFSFYRKTFWKMAWPALKKGDIESLLHVGMVAHHLIFFARECGAGVESASFYSQRMQEQDSSELQSVGAD